MNSGTPISASSSAIALEIEGCDTLRRLGRLGDVARIGGRHHVAELAQGQIHGDYAASENPIKIDRMKVFYRFSVRRASFDPDASSAETRAMIRTGEQYRDGLRDGREVWIDGERVKDVTTPSRPQADHRHPRAHVRHAARGRACADADLSSRTTSSHSIFNRLPREQKDWHDKWDAVDTVMNDIKRRRHPRRRRDRRRDVVAL